MKKFFFIFAFLFVGFCLAEEAEKYTLVEIQANADNMQMLADLGLPLDCCGCEKTKNGKTFLVPLNKADMELLTSVRATYKVVAEDAAAFYAARCQNDRSDAETSKPRATSMKLGSHAGFYTVDEIANTLDSLYNTYKSKNLITEKQVMGKSFQGKNMYVVKISDNASDDESGSEQQVMYTAMHHAREPAGMMAVFYFMYYLLENYETDARVKNIVNNRELFFAPCLNPDGYAYNQQTNPSGGGMWRKNRNGSGTDLNRNYGPDKYWNYANSGSSTSSGSDTYRGKTMFSEPETRALRDFLATKKIRTMLNYHTYSNLLIYPLGVRDEVAHPQFTKFGVKLTEQNGYRHGTAEGLLYPVRGVSDDYMFDAAGIFAMTPEVGSSSDGFWPAKSRIFPLAEENLEANLRLAEYADQVSK